jgi:hypothetical protein
MPKPDASAAATPLSALEHYEGAHLERLLADDGELTVGEAARLAALRERYGASEQQEARA